MAKKSVYEIVTGRIIEKLRQGVIPWRKPWSSHPAINWVTQKPYRGVNQLLLDPGEYATWNQIKKAGGRVKKGTKSELVTFWKMLEVKEKKEMTHVETGETRVVDYIETIPMLRYYKVFNIKDCKGLEPKQVVETFDHDPIQKAEEMIECYNDSPAIVFAPNRAYYRPHNDIISMPDKSCFKKIEDYYSTLFHEVVHSTGHSKRLGREGIKNIAVFGSHRYSREELIAEIGAAMLCGHASIEQATIDNSAAYIQSWLRALDNDKKMVVLAAGQAQKAVDYVLGSQGGKHE